MKKRASKSKKRSTRSKSRPAQPKKRPAGAKARSGAKGRATSSAAKRVKRPAKRGPRPAARPKRSARAAPGRGAARPPTAPDEGGRITPLHEERMRHHEMSPVLSGGDLDADWAGAEGAGEESVGGSVATPDQDVVDEIGRALGVEQSPSEPVTSSKEILQERSRHRWEIEREASEEEDRRER
jgi:hypothetical protein